MTAKRKSGSTAGDKRGKNASASVSKHIRGTASEFFVAAELCRRGYPAVVTLGNCPNTDVLVSDVDATKFAHVQVKTYRPGDRTCTVGRRSERDYGERFFWILVGLPLSNSDEAPSFHIIPASVMSRNTKKDHERWMATPGRKGQAHRDSSVRNVTLKNAKKLGRWDVSRYEGGWDMIERVLT